jgi:hypothetical protein
MAHHSSARIQAVDSSLAWIATVRGATAEQAERISIEAIDLGELGDWGHPTTYRHRFRDYVQSPWQHGSVKPDRADRRPPGHLPRAGGTRSGGDWARELEGFLMVRD